MEPKLIYLASRHPSLSRTGFTARWRQHGALGMSMPRWKNIRRYVHCDVLQSGVAGLRDDFDGVGLIWHRSPEARMKHRMDNSSQGQMEADEAMTFAEPVKNFCLLAEEHELAGGRSGPVKLIRFIGRNAKLSKGEFLDRWKNRLGQAVLNLPAMGKGAVRYVQNHSLRPEQGGAWGLPADCVDELWFESEQAATLALQEFSALADFERELSASIISVMTNEVVLHDRPTAG